MLLAVSLVVCSKNRVDALGDALVAVGDVALVGDLEVSVESAEPSRAGLQMVRTSRVILDTWQDDLAGWTGFPPWRCVVIWEPATAAGRPLERLEALLPNPCGGRPLILQSCGCVVTREPRALGDYPEESRENAIGRTMTTQRKVVASGHPSVSDQYVTPENARRDSFTDGP